VVASSACVDKASWKLRSLQTYIIKILIFLLLFSTPTTFLIFHKDDQHSQASNPKSIVPHYILCVPYCRLYGYTVGWTNDYNINVPMSYNKQLVWILSGNLKLSTLFHMLKEDFFEFFLLFIPLFSESWGLTVYFYLLCSVLHFHPLLNTPGAACLRTVSLRWNREQIATLVMSEKLESVSCKSSRTRSQVRINHFNILKNVRCIESIILLCGKDSWLVELYMWSLLFHSEQALMKQNWLYLNPYP